jgi:hypothetical protein
MRLPSRAGWEAWFYRKRDFPWNMVPNLSVKPSCWEDAGAVEQIGCRAGKRAKVPVTPCPATDAEQMRFCLKSHNSKVQRLKKRLLYNMPSKT